MKSDPNQSTFFFPLRTNVDFFQTQNTYADFQSRAKLALLLFDRLVFQGGVYSSSIGPEGSMDGIRPPMEHDEDVELADQKEAERFWVQMRPSDASPDTPFTTVLDSPLQQCFSANFHPIVAEMRSAGISSVESMPITMLPKAKSRAGQLSRQAIRKLDFDEDERFLYKRVIQNLYLDLILLSDLSWPAGLDPMHSEFVDRIARGHFHAYTPPGFLTLEFSFPHVGMMPWDELADVRNEKSVLELREKLISVERDARKMLGDASTDEIKDYVSRSLIHELVEEAVEGNSGWSQHLGSYAGSLTLTVIGGMLPPAAIASIALDGAKATKGIVESEQFASSWITGFFRLKSASEGHVDSPDAY